MSTSSKKPRRPDIFSYLDFRAFIRDFLNYLQVAQSLSIRQITKKAGFGSTSYLKMITSGARNLSGKSIYQLSTGLGLKKDEYVFFEKLVLFGQSESAEVRDQFLREIIALRKSRRVEDTADAAYEAFSCWYSVAILEVIGSRSGWTLQDFAEALRVSLGDVEKILAHFEKLDLVEKTAKSWQRTQSVLEMPDEIRSLSFRNFHREMIGQALEALDRYPIEERSVGSMTLSLSAENYRELQRRILEFQKDVGREFAEDPKSEKVYQFNTQLFPLLSLEDEE